MDGIPRVLVVDDDPDADRQIMETLLLAEHYSFVFCPIGVRCAEPGQIMAA